MGFSRAVITSTRLQGRKATNTAAVGETRFPSVTGCLGRYNKTQRLHYDVSYRVEACEIRSCTTVEIKIYIYIYNKRKTINSTNEYTVPLLVFVMSDLAHIVTSHFKLDCPI
jgi:hypothetical protein